MAGWLIKLDATIKSRNAAEVVFRKSIYKPNVTRAGRAIANEPGFVPRVVVVVVSSVVCLGLLQKS